MKLERTVIVGDECGLHIRVATRVVAIAKDAKSKITLANDTAMADAASIFQILQLSAEPGGELEIAVEGEDAGAVMEALVATLTKPAGNAEASPAGSSKCGTADGN